MDLAEGENEANLFGHIPGKLNVWADALSRARDPNQALEVPEEIKDIPQAAVAPQDPAWWRTSTRPT